MSDLREELAALAHEQWCEWMRYLFSKCAYELAPGLHERAMVIPPWATERWQRQVATPYADLSEDEKQSDRLEADKIIALLRAREPGNFSEEERYEKT